MSYSLFPEIDEENAAAKAKELEALDILISKSDMVVPSNGTQCEAILSLLCHQCVKYPNCDTNLAFEAGYPQEEIRKHNQIFCVIVEKEKINKKYKGYQ